MYVTVENREVIIKIFNGIGIVIFIAGIFTHIIEFAWGFVIALAFWMFASVFKTWLKVNTSTSENYFQNSRAFSKLLSFVGVWLVCYSIFTGNVSFELAVLGAIILFIIASNIGETRSERRKRRHRVPATLNKPSKFYSEQIPQYNESKVGPDKYLCNSCGSSIMKEDLFCQNCGGKVSLN